MRTKRDMWWAVLCVLVFVVAALPSFGGRVMTYNRTTGAIAPVAGNNETIYKAAINSSSVAYWTDSGLRMVNIATGQVAAISNDAYVTGANLDLTDNYITWNGSLMDLNTGAVSSVSSNAKLWGDYCVSGYGSSYQIQNLAAGTSTNLYVSSSYKLAEFAGDNIIFETGVVHGYDSGGYPGAPPIEYYRHSFMSYGLGGSATGWTCDIKTGIDYYCYLTANEQWTVASCWSLGDNYGFGGGTVIGGIPMDGQAHALSSTSGVPYLLPVMGLHDNTYVNSFVNNPDYAITMKDLSTGAYQNISLHSWDSANRPENALINADYVVWTDAVAVPEPSSLAALVSLAGFGLAMLRRRR